VRTDLEPKQDFVLVGEIADDSPKGRWQLLDQCRRRENPLILGPLWMLEDIYDLQLISPVELLRADTIEIVDRDLGARAGAGDVKRQDVFRQDFLRPYLECLEETVSKQRAGHAAQARWLQYWARRNPRTEASRPELYYNQLTAPRTGLTRDDYRNGYVSRRTRP
jgi:hypothetical protein